MPAFEGQLRPEEIKAVSVFVFSRALKELNPLPVAVARGSQKRNGEQVSLLAASAYFGDSIGYLPDAAFCFSFATAFAAFSCASFARAVQVAGSTKGCGWPGWRFLSSTARSSTPPPG